MITPLLTLLLASAQPRQFLDVTAEMGLSDLNATRLCFVDLNRDGYSDLVVDRHRVFLNVAAEAAAARSIDRRFAELPADEVGLPQPVDGGPVVFADLDNDGIVDALIARNVDKLNSNWEDHGRRTAWCKGLGDGRFWPEQPIEAAPPATTNAVSLTDWNRDGRLDIYLGNWYRQYGESYEGFANDLLLQQQEGWRRRAPVESGIQTRGDDDAGRPTYGVFAAHLALPEALDRPHLIDLNYGRRWNRLWTWLPDEERFLDIGPLTGFDGDEIRHGRYPDWLKERAKTDPRFDRPDETPFRANGNTFDAAVGDVDNDGDFDLLVTEITHGWAGESSDRSRLLFSRLIEAGRLDFELRDAFSLDRFPPEQPNWNQGDLFGALADYDQDGYLDVFLSSGDYPDNQRLRIYHNNAGRELVELSEELGVDHDGSQQLSLGDIDGDGALDIAVGQSFFRYTAEMKEGREPRLKILLNRAANGRSLCLRLEGDPRKGVNRDAIGAVVEVTVGERRVVRQLTPIGGHAGKQHDLLVHFGLANAQAVDTVLIRWPGDVEPTVLEDVPAGSYRLRQGGELTELPLDIAK